jgi:N-acetylmuramoyl-L-alanine amidase
MPSMGSGARGEHVRDLQARLAVLGHATDPDEPGTYGSATEAAVRAFQRKRNLLLDGLVGPDTWHELVEASYSPGDRVLYLRYPPMRGDDVRALQGALSKLGFDAGREDGILGERTERAVRDFQRNAGLTVDGIVGPTTLTSLSRVRSGAGSGGPGLGVVREDVSLEVRRPSVDGARIAVDPAHGPGDPGEIGPGGSVEAEAVMALARAVAAVLEARGAEVLVVRTERGNPSTSERAGAANSAGADAFLSIHLAGHAAPGNAPATVFYCGREDWFSRAGRHLAESVQQALGALGLRDGGIHPVWLPILRETRMPAVSVTPILLADPHTEASLRDPEFVRAVAEALAAGVERFLTTRPHADAPVL